MQQALEPHPQQTNPEVEQAMEGLYEPCARSLNLSWKTDLWMAVMKAKEWSQLREIHLANCSIGDDEVGVISDAGMKDLELLMLKENKIEAEGVRQLLKHKWAKLKTLNLTSNFLQDQGLHELSTTESLHALEHLNLDNNKITHAGLTKLPEYRAHQLTYLTLNYNRIGSRGIKLLVKAELPGLAKIQLYKCAIGAEGVRAISKALWPNLKHLNINDNQISNEGHSQLCLSEFKKLNFLSIWESNPIQVMYLVQSGWPKGLSIDKDVYKGEYKRTINKILKGRFVK